MEHLVYQLPAFAVSLEGFEMLANKWKEHSVHEISWFFDHRRFVCNTDATFSIEELIEYVRFAFANRAPTRRAVEFNIKMRRKC
jgi:hypothetical protein